MKLKNPKAKGSRRERDAMEILQAAGYLCTKSGGSLGLFDVIAFGPSDIRCIQVKAGTRYLSGVEREQIRLLTLPANVSREVWRFPDRCREPLIERL
jgi:Holliday junction resolvase